MPDIFDDILSSALSKLAAPRAKRAKPPGAPNAPRAKRANVATEPHIAERWELASGEVPIGTVTYITVQECRTCGRTHSIVAGEFVRIGKPASRFYQHRDIRSTASAMSTLPLAALQALPHLVDYLPETVLLCHECLALSRFQQDFEAAHFVRGTPSQSELPL